MLKEYHDLVRSFCPVFYRWSFWSVHQAEYFANPLSVCYVALLQHSGAIATVCSVLLRGLTLCKCVVFVC